MKLQQELKSLKTQKAKEEEKKLIQIKKKHNQNNNPKNQKSTNLTVQTQTQDENTKKIIPKMIYIFQTNLNFGEKVPTYKDWKKRISKKHYVQKILFNRNLIGLSVQEMGKISYTIDQKCQEYANNKENKKKDFTIQVKEIVYKYLFQSSSKLLTDFEELKINLGKFSFDLICDKLNFKTEIFYHPNFTKTNFTDFLQELLAFSKNKKNLIGLHTKITYYQNSFWLFYWQKIWYNYLVYFYLAAYLQKNKNLKFLWNPKLKLNNSSKPWLFLEKSVSKKGGYEIKEIKEKKNQQRHRIILLPIIYQIPTDNLNQKKIHTNPEYQKERIYSGIFV
ncbi:hypothetical protein M0812_18294 [Anaeramoeba flamelloides]|uniref:Uncharacterized protein n=1 Tax=Anaeramoeba flamelloides TaxID=1746091 RepID=A0AAV7Z605_9EUKA|nr:hypothetical protein M0812_18294 [Anaeramoeba flamelloides]